MSLRIWYRRHREDVLLAAVVLLLAAPVVQGMQAQQESRYALTAALWDQHTVRLDAYEHILGVDRAEREGHTYSDKAPGQPVFAVPAYALYRAVGGEPATVRREVGNLGLWWVSLWSAAIPAAALALLMRRFAATEAPERATQAALALAVGTLYLPFSTVLFGHVLASLLALSGFMLVLAPAASRRRLALAGLLLGAGVLVEYTVGIVVVVTLVTAVLRHRREAIWVVAGGVAPALALLAYNAAVFGGPLRFSYSSAAGFTRHQEGLVGVKLPSFGLLSQVLLGERGLLTLTPVVAAGVAGAIAGLRKDRAHDWSVLYTAFLVFWLFVLLQAGWRNVTGGASPGPRYVLPGLAFLAPGVALALRRWPRLTTAATVVGVVTMGLATFTVVLAQPTERFSLGFWVSKLVEGSLRDTLLTRWWGDWTILVPLAAAAVLGVRLWRRPRLAPVAEREPEPTRG